jgi:hypothetical protein
MSIQGIEPTECAMRFAKGGPGSRVIDKSSLSCCRRPAVPHNLIASQLREVSTMILRDRMFGFALCLFAVCASAAAAEHAAALPFASAAPLSIPHTTNLELDFRAQRRGRGPGNIERTAVADLPAGLTPVVWPRAGDVRTRLLTPELRRTPLFGWIAENLYRSRRERGWCVEVDPGQGEYLVFYRTHLR